MRTNDLTVTRGRSDAVREIRLEVRGNLEGIRTTDDPMRERTNLREGASALGGHEDHRQEEHGRDALHAEEV